jgi:hypothetical protein
MGNETKEKMQMTRQGLLEVAKPRTMSDGINAALNMADTVTQLLVEQMMDEIQEGHENPTEDYGLTAQIAWAPVLTLFWQLGITPKQLLDSGTIPNGTKNEIYQCFVRLSDMLNKMATKEPRPAAGHGPGCDGNCSDN